MAQGATWAERYATGGTQHRRLRRNAIPMPGHGLDGLGGTLCHQDGTQHRRLQAERYTDARAWPR